MEDKYSISPKNTDNNENKPSMQLGTEFLICQERFIAKFCHTKDGNVLNAVWHNDKNHEFSFNMIANYFGINLPDILNWKIIMESISIEFKMSNSSFDLIIALSKEDDIQSYMRENTRQGIELGTSLDDNERYYTLVFNIKTAFYLKKLPIIKGMVDAESYLGLDNFSLDYKTSFSCSCKISMKIGSFSAEYNLTYNKPVSDKAVLAQEESQVKWINVNKSFKFIIFNRIGFKFANNIVFGYLDVDFVISIIRAECYGFYVSLPLQKPSDFGFGIQGILISCEKNSFAFSGGLYKSPDSQLYNGQVSIRIQNFSLLALASYGEMNGNTSLFAFLMIGTPIGGPTFFFVKGLSAGFGINRKMEIPQNITEFPLVRAARNQRSDLNSKTPPQHALNLLSAWITPSAGDYFITAGVNFVSFGVLKSFALITVEFGNNLRISLLGTTELSIPTEIETGKSPIAYAELLIRIVLDISEGNFSMIGTLSNESYLLSKNCKIIGGFAFCVWFSGKDEGDFVVSIGGYHEDYKNPLYPSLSRIGIDWKITDNLKLEGNAYFALTPTCIMAGGYLALTYLNGNLKAWLKVYADILMKWKPYYYNISAGASIGVSYTTSIFGIKKTLTFELAASMSFWGPEFAGKIRIKLFIISFTISFGEKAQEEEKIGWDEFARSFLPSNNDVKSSQKASYLNFNIAKGLIQNNSNHPVINISNYEFEVKSQLPCTKINCLDCADMSERKLGIVPMKISEYSAELIVEINKDNSEFMPIPIYESFTPALWNEHEPTAEDKLIQNIPVGFRFVSGDPKISDWLPCAYSVENLSSNEKLKEKNFNWSAFPFPVAKDYTDENVFVKIKETFIKNNQRKAITDAVGIYKKHAYDDSILNMGSSPENYMLASPVLRTTGAVNSDIAN